MKRFSLGIVVALITFAMGVMASLLWLSSPPTPSQQPTSPYERGKLKAARDIAAGKLIIRRYGEPIVGYDPYKEILARDYGVELYEGGCVLTDETEKESRGYNESQIAELERRYGAGILDRVIQQSRQDYAEYLKRNPPEVER